MLLALTLSGCGEVKVEVHDDAAPIADTRPVDATPPDVEAAACSSDPVEQCHQIMFNRCDALARCFPSDPNIKNQCIVDTYNTCLSNHFVMGPVHCDVCRHAWDGLVGPVTPPNACRTTQSEQCAACYGLDETSATCPELAPGGAP